MCGALKFLNKDLNPNCLITYSDNDIPTQVYWDGFARKESIGYWADRGYKLLRLEADGFTEKNKEFILQGGERMATMVDVRHGSIKIVTRVATTGEQEATGHDRMPVVLNADDKIVCFERR